MESERKLLMETFKKYEALLDIPPELIRVSLKDPTKSRMLRDKGTALYLEKDHDNDSHARIFSYYSESIAFAPNQSEELALGYGNRSAFLLHIKKYAESILDIDRALACTKSKILKIKLLCRKIKCLKGLGEKEDPKPLEEAQKLLEELDEADSVNNSLTQMILQTKNLYIDGPSGSAKINIKDETKSKILPENLISIKEAQSPMESVSIDYDEKYGRKLIATRDYKPGDIIMVQKMYATILYRPKYYTNCYYCFKTAWAGIPCDHCNWAMFCSQECKDKSWAEYHDIECQIVPVADMSRVTENLGEFFRNSHLSIRLLIMAKREARTWENLRAYLNAVDEIEDPRLKGFSQNGKFTGNTFRSIYSLKSTASFKPLLKHLAINGCWCLLLMTNFTSFLGENEIIDNTQDLLQNDTAIFVGCLILRLMQTTMFNCHVYEGINYPIHESSETHEDFNSMLGMSIVPLCALINHSCYPNARRIFTSGQRIMFLCVLPIKKNDQIFDAYWAPFYKESKQARAEYLQNYEFICDCQACCRNWPPIIEKAEEENMFPTKSQAEVLCANLCNEIDISFRGKEFQFNHKTTKYLSEYITDKASKKKMPSVITCFAVSTLREMFRAFYSFRRESFGSCK